MIKEVYDIELLDYYWLQGKEISKEYKDIKLSQKEEKEKEKNKLAEAALNNNGPSWSKGW